MSEEKVQEDPSKDPSFFLDAKRMADYWLADPKQQTFNFLLLGEMGSGKSFLARTMVKPVHVDSFDPGGDKHLEEYVRAGKIVVDSTYESEDPRNPRMFEEWRRNFEYRVAKNYFDKIGTYYLDGSSMWAESIMNWVLGKAGLAGKPPRFTHDYDPQKYEIRNWIRKMLDLPCHFAISGHLEMFQNKLTGETKYRWMTTGKGTILLPPLFDEVYTLRVSTSVQKKPIYELLTAPIDDYPARSRLAKDGKLDPIEEPDIKKLMTKAGFKPLDKPSLW